MRTKLPYLTSSEILELDQLMINELHVSIYQLMELAGLATANLVQQYFKSNLTGKKISIVCGKGNNGGDGLVAARFLANWQAEPTIILTGAAKELREVPRHQLQSVKSLNLPIINCCDADLNVIKNILHQSDLILDALLGVGLSNEPKAEYATLINLMNQSHKTILAIDCPSGFDATTGQAFSTCIKAALTLTMTAMKTGFKNKEAKEYTGTIYLADIGIPAYLYQKFGQTAPRFKNMIMKTKNSDR